METDDLMKPLVEKARGVPPKKVVVPVLGLMFGVLMILSFISSEQDEPILRGDDVAQKNEAKLSESDRSQMKVAQKMVGESYASSGLTPEILLSSQMNTAPSTQAINSPLARSVPPANSTEPKASGVLAQAQGSTYMPGALELQNPKGQLPVSSPSHPTYTPLPQASTPLPIGQAPGQGGLGLDAKNDLLALKAAKEIEALNSKMVVADFDDRLPGFGATPSDINSTARTPNALGLSEEQAQTLNRLRQKANQLSSSNPLVSLGFGSSGAGGAGLASPSKAAPALDAWALRDSSKELEKTGLQKASELLAAWSNPLGDGGVGSSALNQNTSASNKDGLFLKEFASSSTSSAGLRPRRLESAGSIFEGSVIPAVLARDIVSDLPGTLTALVAQDVYDSLTSSSVLICKGAKLVGRYNHDVRVGQSRLMFAFTRLILNSGESFDLSGFEGSDALGRAGYEGDVNNHFLKIYGSSLAIGVLSDQVTKQSQIPQGTFAQPSATGQIMVQTTKEMLTRARDVSPTLTIEHGTPINVEVRRDLIFPSAKRQRCT